MRYEVQILEQPFENEFVKRPRTARVTFYTDNDGSNTSNIIKEYGVIEQFEVEQQIALDKSVNIDYCYIKQLTLDQCTVKSFSASFAFIESGSFESTVFADKAYFLVSFFGKAVSFFKSIFSKEVYFESVHFNGKAIFSDAAFNGEANFTHANFRKKVDFKAAIFDGKVEFVATVFHGEAIFSQVVFEQEVYFESAAFLKNSDFMATTFNEEANLGQTNFGGDVNFESAVFSGKTYCVAASFDNQANFTHTTFLKEANFDSAIFRGKAEWVAATFGEEANFIYVKFSDNAVFSLATFMGECVFRTVVFGAMADFVAVTFGKVVSFANANFINKAGFRSTIFSATANFESVIFHGETDFTYGAFEETVNFEGATFNTHVNMSNLNTKGLFLNQCTIEKTLDLRHSEIAMLSLLDVKNMGPIYIEWNRERIVHAICESEVRDCNGMVNKNCVLSFQQVLQLKQILSSKYETRDTPHLKLSRQFRLLKENFRSLGQYDDEDAAYVQFKKQEALSMLMGEGEKSCLRRRLNVIQYPFKWFIADLIGLYGTSPKRILLSLIANIGIFALIYYACGFGHLEAELQLNTAFRDVFGNGDLGRVKASLYFSAITSFTVGYGDLIPRTGWVAFWACIESFLGVSLMSYFTVAFSRKVLR